MQRIATQMNALKKGFQDILPLDAIKIFDEKEVEVRSFVQHDDDVDLCRFQLLVTHQRSRRDQCERLANLYNV